MTAVIYEASSKVVAAALPVQRARVIETPAVYEDQTIPAITEERDGETVEIEPARTISVLVVGAVYRDETIEEMITRLVAAGHMPDLPWTRHMIVADFPPGEHATHWTVDWPTGAVTRLGPSAAELRAYAADKRYRVEIGGCLDPAGRAIATDRDSQTKLLAEMVALGAGMRIDPSGWKLLGNGFVMLANAEMLAAIGSARMHITTAFATEAAVLGQIESGSVTTFAQIDAAEWPANA